MSILTELLKSLKHFIFSNGGILVSISLRNTLSVIQNSSVINRHMVLEKDFVIKVQSVSIDTPSKATKILGILMAEIAIDSKRSALVANTHLQAPIENKIEASDARCAQWDMIQVVSLVLSQNFWQHKLHFIIYSLF